MILPPPIQQAIEKRRSKRRSSLKRYLLITTAFAALTAGSLYMLDKHKDQTIPADHSIDATIAYYQAHQKALDTDYGSLVSLVKSHLHNHPDQANRLVRSGLESLSSEEIEPQTYQLMFEQVYSKIEEDPLLSDHLGPRAAAHLRQKYAEKPTADDLQAGYNLLKTLRQRSYDLVQRVLQSNDSPPKDMQVR